MKNKSIFSLSLSFLSSFPFTLFLSLLPSFSLSLSLFLTQINNFFLQKENPKLIGYLQHYRCHFKHLSKNAFTIYIFKVIITWWNVYTKFLPHTILHYLLTLYEISKAAVIILSARNTALSPMLCSPHYTSSFASYAVKLSHFQGWLKWSLLQVPTEWGFRQICLNFIVFALSVSMSLHAPVFVYHKSLFWLILCVLIPRQWRVFLKHSVIIGENLYAFAVHFVRFELF